MTVDAVVTDPTLQSVVTASKDARAQAIALLQLASAPSTTALSRNDAALTLSKQQKVLYGYLAQLRGLHRQATLGARDTKVETAEARQEVDKLHLQLQNLYYEQKHLEGEIAACRDYRDLPLIPLNEFFELFPQHAELDQNALTIARIEHEHTEREKLEQQRLALVKTKQALIADNKKRKDDLTNLDKQLENFIDAAKPIQKTLEKAV